VIADTDVIDPGLGDLRQRRFALSCVSGEWTHRGEDAHPNCGHAAIFSRWRDRRETQARGLRDLRTGATGMSTTQTR
jgi:hypothetical protein